MTDDLDAQVDRFCDDLDAALRDACTDAAILVAQSAHDVHRYQNRTGNLEEHTTATFAEGRATEGTCVALAIADMPYASYVEENPRFRFMAPALARSRQGIRRLIQGALEALGSR